MGFWKKFGTIVGRVAVQAGVSALEAKASGKPITIGTVGPGVLNEELRRISNETSPPVMREGVGVMDPKDWIPPVTSNRFGVYEAVDGKHRIWYYEGLEEARAHAAKVGSMVMEAVETRSGYQWVPVRDTVK